MKKCECGYCGKCYQAELEHMDLIKELTDPGKPGKGKKIVLGHGEKCHVDVIRGRE